MARLLPVRADALHDGHKPGNFQPQGFGLTAVRHGTARLHLPQVSTEAVCESIQYGTTTATVTTPTAASNGAEAMAQTSMLHRLHSACTGAAISDTDTRVTTIAVIKKRFIIFLLKELKLELFCL